jgi:uncharacterized membrane protein (DUF373 family)
MTGDCMNFLQRILDYFSDIIGWVFLATILAAACTFIFAIVAEGFAKDYDKYAHMLKIVFFTLLVVFSIGMITKSYWLI